MTRRRRHLIHRPPPTPDSPSTLRVPSGQASLRDRIRDEETCLRRTICRSEWPGARLVNEERVRVSGTGGLDELDGEEDEQGNRDAKTGRPA